MLHRCRPGTAMANRHRRGCDTGASRQRNWLPVCDDVIAGRRRRTVRRCRNVRRGRTLRRCASNADRRPPRQPVDRRHRRRRVCHFFGRRGHHYPHQPGRLSGRQRDCHARPGRNARRHHRLGAGRKRSPDPRNDTQQNELAGRTSITCSRKYSNSRKRCGMRCAAASICKRGDHARRPQGVSIARSRESLPNLNARCSTAWHAALAGRYLFEELARIPTVVDYASELRYRNPIIEETPCRLNRQSGASPIRLARKVRAKRRSPAEFVSRNKPSRLPVGPKPAISACRSGSASPAPKAFRTGDGPR